MLSNTFFFRVEYEKITYFFIFTWTNGQRYFILLILAYSKHGWKIMKVIHSDRKMPT
jgi:hypothetical protein